MKRWTTIIRVNKNLVDESFGDEEDDDSIKNKQINEDWLDLSTAIGQSPATSHGNEVRSSPVEMKEQNLHENDKTSAGEQVCNQVKVP